MLFSFYRRNVNNSTLVKAFEAALDDTYPKLPLHDLKTIGAAREAAEVFRRIASLPLERMAAWTAPAALLLRFAKMPEEGKNLGVGKILLSEVIPKLVEMEKRLHTQSQPKLTDARMVCLASLARLGKHGGDAVLNAIAEEFEPGHATWYEIFTGLYHSHGDYQPILEKYAQQLPPKSFAFHFLHLGKRICLQDWNARHILDRPEAIEWFEDWILAPNVPGEQAVDAVVSLAFCDPTWANNLTTLALNHPDLHVRMEAAWACGMRGDVRGLRMLAECCLDYKTAGRAQTYLRQIGQEKWIPLEADLPENRTKAQLTAWTENPDSGYEAAPTAVERIFDLTTSWIGQTVPTRIYILQYLMQDPRGLRPDGWGYIAANERKPESFAGWERFDEVDRPSFSQIVAVSVGQWEIGHTEQEGLYVQNWSYGDENAHLLKEWPGSPLKNAKIGSCLLLRNPHPGLPWLILPVYAKGGHAVMEFSDKQALLFWRWYPSDLRTGDRITEEHLGRRLLGCLEHPLEPSEALPPLPPQNEEAFIKNYEIMLERAYGGSQTDRQILMQDSSTIHYLPQGLPRYIHLLLGRREETRLRGSLRRLACMVEIDKTAYNIAEGLGKIEAKIEAQELLARTDLKNAYWRQTIAIDRARAYFWSGLPGALEELGAEIEQRRQTIRDEGDTMVSYNLANAEKELKLHVEALEAMLAEERRSDTENAENGHER